MFDNAHFTNKQEGQDGPGLLTRVFEITLAIFFVPFREGFTRISLTVQCKLPPFTNTTFIDRSKFRKQFFFKRSLKEHFYEIISKSDL